MTCDVNDEDLARHAAGEQAVRAAGHVDGCAACQAKLAALRRADLLLRALPPARPSAAALLRVRRALAAEIHADRAAEIMTLEEAAAFLRLTVGELDEIIGELPAFEVAGQVRVRRTRLTEWVAQREQSYLRANVGSWLSRSLAPTIEEGVA